MEWVLGGRHRRRRMRGRDAAKRDTALLHSRLRDAPPLELYAHVSRVACCVVIADVATVAPKRRSASGASVPNQVCIVSGDAIGNLSVFYMTLQELCAHHDPVDEAAGRPRRRPDVKFRGAHRGSINCMLQIRATSMVLTGGDDGAVRLWDVREDLVQQSKLQCVQEFLYHPSCVLACDSDPTQTFFVTAGFDGVVAVWLFDTPIPLLTIAIDEPCTGVFILPGDPSLIQVAHQDQVSVWDIRAQPHYIHFQRALAQIVRARLEGSLQHLAKPDRMKLENLQSTFPSQDTFAWLKDSDTMERCLTRMKVSGAPPPVTSRRFDERSQRYIHPFAGHHAESRLLAAASMFDGQAVLTSASDFTHKLWNCSTSEGIATFHHSPAKQDSTAITSADLTPAGVVCHAGRFLYGADANGGVHVWDLRASVASLSRQSDGVVPPRHSIRGHAFFVTSIALSHDDAVLATGDASGKIHVRVASA